MPTPANSTLMAVRGQAFNFSGVLKDPATGNPKIGGLSGLTAWVSKDDATFVAATSAPVERGSSAWVSLDLTADEMNASKVDVMIQATGAITWCQPIATADMRSHTERYDDAAIIDVTRLFVDLHDYLWNRNEDAGALQTIYNSAGFAKGSGNIVEGDLIAFRSKIE